MPAALTLTFATPPRPPSPRHLLGAAAQLFETPGSDHHADSKPFATGPLTPAEPGGSPAMTVWRLGWLGHGDLPSTWPPRTVRFVRASNGS